MQGGADGALVFYAFDLLEVDGEDLTRLPLVERKMRLAKLIGRRRKGPIRYSDHIEGPGVRFFEQACGSGLEGVISKRADAPYAVGKRSDAWLKVKCLQRQEEFVLVGWIASDKDRGFVRSSSRSMNAASSVMQETSAPVSPWPRSVGCFG